MHRDLVGSGDSLIDVGTALQIEVFARRYYALFNERRLDEAERMVDPQAVFTYPIARERLIGRAGYRELARRWIEAFPDARVAIVSVEVRESSVVAVELHAEGTHRGVLELPGLPAIEPTGRRAQLPMRETSRVSHGLISESCMEFDPTALQQALGL